MARTRLIGPLNFRFDGDGLAPGQSTHTFWTTDPPLSGGTVQFTVQPDFPEVLAAPPGGITLAVANPAIQLENGGVGPARTPIQKLTLHVDVINVGEHTARSAQMYISFIEG